MSDVQHHVQETEEICEEESESVTYTLILLQKIKQVFKNNKWCSHWNYRNRFIYWTRYFNKKKNRVSRSSLHLN